MWFKNIGSKGKEREKNFGGQEDAIDYDEEEEHKRDDAVDEAEDGAMDGIVNGAEDGAMGGNDDNAVEGAHQREDASDEEECPLDDVQINEQIENLIKNMSSDEEEEGEVVEDEIPYDRIETNSELNKEVILLNFYTDMSSHRLTSLMNIFGKVKLSFIDDNEGVHVIFNSVKSSKRAKEYLDHLKIKNRRIQVVYGTYQERGDDPRVDGASAQGEDTLVTGEMRRTPNDAYTTSYPDISGNHKNGKTPVKLYKNRKYYQNTIPTHAQNNEATHFTYNSEVRGMAPHVNSRAYFVPPPSSTNRLNEFVPPSEMPFSQQGKAPINSHLHGHTRGGTPNKHHHNRIHHPDEAALHDMSPLNNAANYVHPPPPPPPRSVTLYSQSFNESGRGGQMESYPHYSHPNNPPGRHPNNIHHPSSYPGGGGPVNRMPNNPLLPPPVKSKKMTANFPNTFSGGYKKNSFEAPPGNPPYVSYSNQHPTSGISLHMKGVPPPPHLIGSSTHAEASTANHPMGGNQPPLLIIPRTRDHPASATMPPYSSGLYRSHASNNQHHGGNTSYGNVASGEDYPHTLYANYEEYTPHGAQRAQPPHIVKSAKLARYSETGRHRRYQNPLFTSEREVNLNGESFEHTPFNEDNPFGISEENQMVDNPTWNERKTKPVLHWDQDASVEMNHLDSVDSFRSTKVFNRYLLVTNIPDHLDNENKVKEHINELFSSEKVPSSCVDVSLFVSIEVDEERFFKNAIKGEEEQEAAIEAAEEAVKQEEGEVVNPEADRAVNEAADEAVKQEEGEVVNPEADEAVTQAADEAVNQGADEAEDNPKGGRRRGAKKAAAPRQRRKRGKAKEEEEQQEQKQEQLEQLDQANEAGAGNEAGAAATAATAADAGAAPGKRYAHLTFRTIKNCLQAKKVLEKNKFRVTFSVPIKANGCLWIGNILKTYFDNTVSVVLTMFAHFGPMKNVKYVWEKSCLFLQYSSVTDAIKARNHMYGLQVSNGIMLNIDFSILGDGEIKQQKISITRKRLLDSLAYDNGEMKGRLESTLRRRNNGFIDSKVMLLLKEGHNHDSHTGDSHIGTDGVRIKRYAPDRSDDYNVRRRPNIDQNHSRSTSLHRRRHRSSAIDSHLTSNSANDKTRGGHGHSRYDNRETRRSSKRKGTTTSYYYHHDYHGYHDDYDHHGRYDRHDQHDHRDHHNHHRHHYDHHRRHKRKRSRNSASDDRGGAAGYSFPGEGGSASQIGKRGPNGNHAEEHTDSDFNSLDGVELNDYNDIQKTVSFYVNQKYKCDFISNFYDGNPELKIYPKLNVETKSDVQNLMNIRNSCIDYSVWQLGPTVKQKKKFVHICEHFSKKKNIPVIIDKNLTIFIVPMKEDYLKDLGVGAKAIDNPDFMYAFVLQTKKA
ncbi:hypothetical protein C922_04400 [Plasmodium inui San Antonio 1]|uniref:RRM domain-containing protein n=1 Tax=Plasmodium inui San Antonio 1 TaxID=1237626 RepID=W7AJ04_9APIC|nr:hypothetical protein C922_04400 [Plasmodium inui San Antonio 1]EUD65271.1 hypothetical protein C922_04400 [Plasmodium inui San Antonio 1]